MMGISKLEIFAQSVRVNVVLAVPMLKIVLLVQQIERIRLYVVV